jgi:hypothetical protein
MWRTLVIELMDVILKVTAFVTTNMGKLYFSETSVNYGTIRRHISEASAVNTVVVQRSLLHRNLVFWSLNGMKHLSR